MQVFDAVAESGGVSQAARRLGSSPSAVSQQLSNLESALSVQLVDRAARPVQLTPAGQMFRRRTRNILDELAVARAELAASNLAGMTRLRLGMIEDFDADVTPMLLRGLADDMPSCRFLLETGASHQLLALLESRDLDLVVAADIGSHGDWVEVHPLVDDPFVAAVPMACGQGGICDLDGLATVPLIHYTQRHHMGRQIAAHLVRHNLTWPQRFELDSYHAILALVADGAGWTILTTLGFLRAHRFADQVALVPAPLPPLSRRISLYARCGVLGDLPAQLAATLRILLREAPIAVALARYPWLSGRFAVVETDS